MDESLKELFRMVEYRDEFILMLLEYYCERLAHSPKLIIHGITSGSRIVHKSLNHEIRLSAENRY